VSYLQFEHVTKSFDDSSLAAVSDCTFGVEAGSFVVLLGPSGCGKTTLLKMVNRLIEPTVGKIELDGQDIRTLDVTALRRRIGYVIQQVGLFPHLTVAQNIAVVPELVGWEKKRIEARVDELLELVQLEPKYYRKRFPAQLSGGQQQRIGLARALAADPPLLLMDEPFGAIDAIARASLQDEMLELKRALQKTVLFVTHDVDEALRLADKIVVLHEGRVAQYDTPFKLLTAPANDFVRALVGADDTVRQLSIMRAGEVMAALPPNYSMNGTPSIQADDSLRDALVALLQAGSSEVVVVADGQPVGVLELERIRNSAKMMR
jgi:osmoprotectant transport system ATP-binding protein